MVNCRKVNKWRKLKGGRGYFNNVCYADSRVLTPVIKATSGDLRVSLLLLVWETEVGQHHKKANLCSAFRKKAGGQSAPPPSCLLFLNCLQPKVSLSLKWQIWQRPILIPFHLSSSGSVSAMKIMWEWNEVVSLKASGEHSTNVRVYPSILGCIFFPQVESSMSYKFTMKLIQLKKNEMEMRKNTPPPLPPHTRRKHPYISFQMSLSVYCQSTAKENRTGALHL